jgi:hypothetical protein
MLHYARKAAALGAAATVALAGLVSPAGAAPARKSEAPVFRVADLLAGTPVPVGDSSLVATGDGLSARLATSSLDAGDAVTMWWVVFNDPAECEAGMGALSQCGPADHLAGRGEVSVLHAAGRIVDRDGTASYGAHLRVGDTRRALEGDGLTNLAGAEVVLVLRTHGPKIPGQVPEQLRTFAGGCHDQSDVPDGAPEALVGSPGPNDCGEVQLSVHRGAES